MDCTSARASASESERGYLSRSSISCAYAAFGFPSAISARASVTRAVCSIEGCGPRAIRRAATADASRPRPSFSRLSASIISPRIDQHAIRIQTDQALERVGRSLEIALVVLGERKIVERVVAERGKIGGGEFQSIDRAQIVVRLVCAIAVEECSLPVGRRRVGCGSGSRRRRSR